MPNNQTKGLAQGAMAIAFFAIIVAISFYVPLVSIITIYFAPLPLAWYGASNDRKQSIFVAILAFAITFFIGGLTILPITFILATIGLLIGLTLQLKKSKLYVLMSTGFLILIVFALIYMMILWFFEIDLIKAFMQLVRDSYKQSMATTQSITGQSPLNAEALELVFLQFEMTIPATVTLTAFTLAFIIISINLPILKRLGINVPMFSALKDLKLPRSILWYYLIVLSINLFVQPELGTTLYVICLNLSMILWVLLTIQGLSFILYLLDKKFKVTNFIKVLVILLAIPFYSFVILIGIIDLGFDIRSLVKDKVQK